MGHLERKTLKKPDWLKSCFRNHSILHDIKRNLRSHSLNTVCESARCPNIFECFAKKTATFMIMGDTCTRNCGFCAVGHGRPRPLDMNEPGHVADMVRQLRLRHVVITSVTRDDLKDGGASHFAVVVRAVRDLGDNSKTIEVLTPDFNGDEDSIKIVLDAGPDVFNHNLETVERLAGQVRDKADYRRSLGVIRFAKGYMKNNIVKSGVMVGLGESDEEVLETLDDLSDAGCDVVTIGQYLRPGVNNLPVERYVEPDVFKRYKEYGEASGIKSVFSGPLVRSSYMAEGILNSLRPN